MDLEGNVVLMNTPEKNGNRRVLKATQNLISMVDNLPKKNRKSVWKSVIHSIEAHFYQRRKCVAMKL
jgi:hypothetical protein